MVRGAFRPGAAPLVIGCDRTRDFLEIGEHDAIGDETRAPMGNGSLEAGIGRHAPNSPCVSLGLAGLFVATVPRHEATRAPVHQQLEADTEGGKQQYADESFVVMVGARIV